MKRNLSNWIKAALMVVPMAFGGVALAQNTQEVPPPSEQGTTQPQGQEALPQGQEAQPQGQEALPPAEQQAQPENKGSVHEPSDHKGEQPNQQMPPAEENQ